MGGRRALAARAGTEAGGRSALAMARAMRAQAQAAAVYARRRLSERMKPKRGPQGGVQHKSPTRHRRPRGRPKALVMPEPIPDTPENILRACTKGSTMKDWDYLKRGSDASDVETSPTRQPPRGS